LAICLATLFGSILTTISTTKRFKNTKKIIVPNILNIKCIIAALLAFLFAPILDINEVTQVPIFCPYNIGKAEASGTNPWDAKTTNIPIAADELCIIAVIPNPKRSPKIGYLPNVANKSVNPLYSANGFTATFIDSIPVNSKPKPINTSPTCLYFSLPPNKYSKIPIPNASGAKPVKSNDTIWAVIVVPIFAPIITPTACGSPIRPALTKPTTITVVALELCITAVTTAPRITPIKMFLVKSSIIFFILDPATFSNDSPIRFIPYKNRPRPPKRLITICTLFLLK